MPLPSCATRPAGPTGTAPRLLAGWYATGSAEGYAAHLSRHGPVPIPASGRARMRVRDAVEASGLRGRGGGGYPTGTKMSAVAAARGRAIVVGNGCESEPSSGKDHALLRLAPHLVLDGLVLAAGALNTSEAVLCLHREDPLVTSLTVAITQRGDPVRIRLVEVPRRYVASEASALVNFLSTGDARPTTRPPRTATRGVDRRPTLVDNVETLAHLALIARRGPDWFRSVGTTRSPGSALVTVDGAVRHPGVHEIAHGTPLAMLLELSGGPTMPLSAVLVGGWGGTWVPEHLLGRLDHSEEGLAAAGATPGPGILSALPEHACGLAETARILDHLARASAGQCGPCMFGLPTVATEFDRLVTGPSSRADLERLRGHLVDIDGRGACAHPDGAAGLAASALTAFGDDLSAHADGRPCLGASAPPLLSPPPRPMGTPS